jgi:hypothetical protein
MRVNDPCTCGGGVGTGAGGPTVTGGAGDPGSIGGQGGASGGSTSGGPSSTSPDRVDAPGSSTGFSWMVVISIASSGGPSKARPMFTVRPSYGRQQGRSAH